MMRNRLARLERLATERVANCPGCVRIPALFLVPPLRGDDRPARTVTDADMTARCETCGNVQRRTVVRFCVQGLPEPTLVMGEAA
jgi:hypothetical protein